MLILTRTSGSANARPRGRSPLSIPIRVGRRCSKIWPTASAAHWETVFSRSSMWARRASPDLPAKPVIDIDLTVRDSSDEAAYVPALEQVGFVLQIREPRWHEHRCLVATVTTGQPARLEPRQP